MKKGVIAAAAAFILTAAELSAEAQDYAAYRSELENIPVGTSAAEVRGENGPGFLQADYTVSVPTEGMYNISLDYAAVESTNRSVLVGLKINGEYPFDEAVETELARVHRDGGPITEDENGNERAPHQEPVYSEQTQMLKNTSGYYSGAYEFYLKEGENLITVTSDGADFRLLGVRVTPAERTVTYGDYDGAAKAPSSGQLIKIQAENASLKSTSMLYPTYDRISAATEDSGGSGNDAAKIRINTAGGDMWKKAGEWMTWEFDVPESGCYNLGIKFRQNYKDGLFNCRDFYIDGKLPFSEMAGVTFPYDNEWQTAEITDSEGEPCLIYLEKGKHELKAEVSMGPLADTLRRMNECVQELNDLYLKIIMITGTDPDSHTDFFLTDKIEGLEETLAANRDKLRAELKNIEAVTGGRGSATSAVDTLAVQLDLLCDEPEEIPARLSAFKNNISALGTWVIDMQEQKLQLDYIYFRSPDVLAPKTSVGFFSRMWYSIRRFFASFDDSTGAVSGGGSVKVWLSGAGRDQAQVIKDLINESFTPETGIQVDLELVQGSLIEATLAGTGPDVALLVAEDQPVNFALRGALQDVSVFDTYKEVEERFYPSALEPFRFNGGVYALPDTQVFDMLFYRTDVFENLGIKAPDTWDDFYDILPVIQRSNLQITTMDLFPTLLFQNGGSYYNSDHTAALLDSDEAIEAMDTYTALYRNYGFEVKTDFYSRFRSGELIMSIQPYQMYNQLIAAAPEISGRWAMTPIPATKTDHGLDRSAGSTVTGTIMLKSAKDPEAAWDFMEWWSRDEVKTRYAVETEGLLGPSARFTPANKNVLSMLPWPEAQLKSLEAAQSSVRGIPQIPGSYYTARAIQNGFRSVVYNGESVRKALRDQNEMINYEIAKKRAEFGLSAGGENDE